MRRALRIGAWTLGALLMIGILFAGALVLSVRTAPGRALIGRSVAGWTEGEVKISELSGVSFTAIELGRIDLSDKEGIWLSAERVSLQWSPMALLSGRIEIDRLRVARLRLLRRPVIHPSHRPGGAWPRIDIADAALKAFELSPALAGASARLSVRGSAHWGSSEDARLDVLASRLDGAGRYALKLQVAPAGYEAQLELREPAGGLLSSLARLPGLGALLLTASVTGARSAQRVEVSAWAGDLRGDAGGTINLVAHSIDLHYDMHAPAMAPRVDLTWQRMDLHGRWHGAWTQPAAIGALQVDRLRLPGDVRIAALGLDLRAQNKRISADGAANGLIVPGPRPRLLHGSPIHLSAELGIGAAARSARVAATHPLFSVAAQWEVGGAPGAAFEVQLPNLKPLAEVAGLTVSGSAVIKGQLALGSPRHLKLDAAGHIVGATPWARMLGQAPQLHLSATLTDSLVRLDRFTLLSKVASLSAAGSAEWPSDGSRTVLEALHAEGDLSVRDVSMLSPVLSGSLSLHGRLDGPWKSLSARIDALSNLSVRNSPLGTIRAVLKAQGLPGAPGGTLQVNGMLDSEPLSIEAALDRDGNGGLRATLTRSAWKTAQLEGALTIGATHPVPEGTLILRIRRLGDLRHLLGVTLDGSATGKLALHAVQGRAQSHLELSASDLVVGHGSGRVTVIGDGFPEALNVQVSLSDATLAGVPVALQGVGRLNLNNRLLDIRKLEMIYHQQPLQLLAPMTLAFKDAITLTPLKLGIRDTVLELRGQLVPTLNLRATVQGADPILINALLPLVLTQGTFKAEAAVTGSLAAPRGSVRVAGDNVRFAGQAARDLPALSMRGSVQLSGSTALIDAQLDAGKDLTVSLAGQAPLGRDADWDLKLNGRLEAGFFDSLLETNGVQVTGALTMALDLKGRAQTPDIQGRIDLAHGDLRAYAQGIHLSNITARVIGSDGLLKVETLTAQAGEGVLSASGTIGALKADVPVELHFVAQNATPIASDIVTATLDADLHMAGALRRGVTTSGTIRVRHADLSIPKNLPPNVAVLEVRVRGMKPPVPRSPDSGASVDISVSAPRQIHVHGRGLDAELGGDLRIQGSVAAPRVTGGFDLLRGSIALGSSRLKFTAGRISFSGVGPESRIDPSLDFTAQSIVGDATCKLQVTGFVDSPEFRLSSVPQLPQDEILSRLLFAQNASQLTALQAAQVGAAVATFSGIRAAGPNLLATVQSKLKLDTLSVGTVSSGSQKSAVTIEAGRYVSDRVYVAGKTISGGGFELGVDFEVTKHLKLETKLGNDSATAQGATPQNDPGSSVGIAYQFEY